MKRGMACPGRKRGITKPAVRAETTLVTIGPNRQRAGGDHRRTLGERGDISEPALTVAEKVRGCPDGDRIDRVGFGSVNAQEMKSRNCPTLMTARAGQIVQSSQ